MRTTFPLFFGLLMGVLLTPLTGQSQVCTPDPNAPASGIFPDTLANACPGVPYNAVITLGIPNDTTINGPFGPITATIDTIIINNITDLPPGITYACEPPTCKFPGGTKGCVVFSGTPTAGGTFLLDLDVTLISSGLSLPGTLTDTLELVVGFSGSVATTDASCGGNDGSATITGLDGTAPYTFAWSDGQTDSVAVNLAAGGYTVDVTDATGCTVSFSVSVNSSGGTAPVIDSTASVVGWAGCHDVDGGFIQPTISGGAAPLTYAWSNGATTPDLSGVPAGNYSLTVTGNDGCSSSESFAVVAPAPLTLSSNSVENVSCFGESDGTAAVLRQGGQGPNFSFTWTPGNLTGASVVGLSAGMYTVTVEDAIGCQRSLSLQINEPEELLVEATATPTSGSGISDGSATATASGGTGAYLYDWGSAGSGEDITGLTPGLYVVTVTDENGCTATDSVEVTTATSIALAAGVETMQVYPNPSRGQFTLDLRLAQPEAVQVRVLDLQGRELRRQRASSSLHPQLDLDLRQAPRGTYLLEVQVGEARLHTRVMLR